MDVYKANIKSDGSLYKLKLRILVREYTQNKELVGDNWSPTASMRTSKYFLADSIRKKHAFINDILLDHSCKQNLRSEYL